MLTVQLNVVNLHLRCGSVQQEIKKMKTVVVDDDVFVVDYIPLSIDPGLFGWLRFCSVSHSSGTSPLSDTHDETFFRVWC